MTPTTTRSFEVAGGAHRVAFGANPRVVVAAGEPYTTDDPTIAARLAAHPHITETTPKPAPKRAAKATAEEQGS